MSHKFKVGVYGGLNITSIGDRRSVITFDKKYCRRICLAFDDDEYFTLNYKTEFLAWGGSIDLIDSSSYRLHGDSITIYAGSSCDVSKQLTLDIVQDDSTSSLGHFKPFMIGKIFNLEIIKRTPNTITIDLGDGCYTRQNVHRYQDFEFIYCKSHYLDRLSATFNDCNPYYYRLLGYEDNLHVILSTSDYFVNLGDDRLEKLFESKFDFSILDGSSSEIVPIEPVQEVPNEPKVIDIIDSAETVHKRICDNFEKVERTLYDICVDLKSIRDNKYYKSLGYDTFEAYCLECFNMSRRNAYRFISVAENLSSEFVTTSSQIGLNKMYVLSRLTESERTEILETTDIEHTPVKQVEQKAKEIKQAREVTKDDDTELSSQDKEMLDIINDFEDFMENSDVSEIAKEHGITLHQDDTSNVENTPKTKIKKVSLDYSVLDFIYKTLIQSKNSLFIDKFDKHEIYRNLDLVTDILLQHFPKLYK